MSDASLDSMLGREWLETNGLGSFASGTVSGAATRRYHGLFVAALEPPARRHVLLSRVDDEILVGETKYELATNVYRDAVAPEGYRRLDHFEARPVATWLFRVGNVEVERRVWMPQGRQMSAVTYRIRAGRSVEGRVVLSLRPMVSFRDFHGLAHERDGIDAGLAVALGVVVVQPRPELPPLALYHSASRFAPSPQWCNGVELREELARGYDGHEDLYSHGEFIFEVLPGEECFHYFIASLEIVDSFGESDARALERNELKRRDDRSARARASWRAGLPSPDAQGTLEPLDRWTETFATRLAEASEQFLVSRKDGGRSVIAGYPWFGDWGRDTFVALPGLAIATGRWPLMREVLKSFASSISGGLIPNRFSDDGTRSDYNSVDASLWFIEASRRVVGDSGDLDFARWTLFPAIEAILDAYASGTRFGIGVDPTDGLLSAGADGVALTWMDAVVDGLPVTPRRGKPVEVNALWYNALMSGADVADALGLDAHSRVWRHDAENVRRSFNDQFWNPESRFLFDVIDGTGGGDPACRPNQVFSISLHHDVLDENRREDVLQAVQSRLLTPVGLRTLDPADARYRGRCAGNIVERDGAYHIGTVWPWLLGPFCTAYLRTHGRTDAAKSAVREWIAPMARHLGTEAGLGSISEIFDGEAPHSPRGCIAQAWSVAELARVLLEELRLS
ncbi:MAG: amylo-alpha-1,6-glucosidase [Blastocatellia bacterium]